MDCLPLPFPSMASSISASTSRPLHDISPRFASILYRKAHLVRLNSNLLLSAAGSFGLPGRIGVMKQLQPADQALKAATAPISHHQQVIVPEQSAGEELSSGGWTSFVETVSGEWDGYGADFTSDGKPLGLPEAVIPDAYREWGVDVHDWQTQCPTLGDKDKGKFFYKVIRLYPTVGCEADAATPYSIEERKIETGSKSGILAFHQSGCFSAVWPGKGVQQESKGYPASGVVTSSASDNRSWEVEHCLVESGNNEKSRVRVLHEFIGQSSLENATVWPSVRKITIYREVWEGPFKNGESLGGCSISGSGFATTPPLEPSLLAGSWHVQESTCDFNDVSVGRAKNNVPEYVAELTYGASTVKEKDLSDGCIFLPKGVWSIINVNKAGYLHVEAGWLVHPDKAIVYKSELSLTGEIQKTTLSLEQRQM